MQIVLKPITKQNRAEALALHVAKGQEGFVESVAQCLKEADEYDVWRPVALYVEGKMVGFAMYGFFPMYLPAGRVWMDRLLIDERFQHKGYGKSGDAASAGAVESRIRRSAGLSKRRAGK